MHGAHRPTAETSEMRERLSFVDNRRSKSAAVAQFDQGCLRSVQAGWMCESRSMASASRNGRRCYEEMVSTTAKPWSDATNDKKKLSIIYMLLHEVN